MKQCRSQCHTRGKFDKFLNLNLMMLKCSVNDQFVIAVSYLLNLICLTNKFRSCLIFCCFQVTLPVNGSSITAGSSSSLCFFNSLCMKNAELFALQNLSEKKKKTMEDLQKVETEMREMQTSYEVRINLLQINVYTNMHVVSRLEIIVKHHCSICCG